MENIKQEGSGKVDATPVQEIFKDVEYKADGVNYIDGVKIPVPVRGRRFNTSVPKIYVNDDSNGINLIHAYSYKNYNSNEKPSVKNNYINNFKSSLTANITDDAGDPTRLHPHADSGGYSDYTISYRVH